MKVLLTGHSGFVGKHVDRVLRECGFVVHRASKLSGCDLEKNSVSLELPDSDVIIHLAGAVGVENSWIEPEHFFRTNHLVTLSIVEYARTRNTPIIFLSSYMYGNPEYLPIDEKHPVRCNNPYAYSKKIAEELLISYHQLFGLAVKICRPMNLYGSGMPDNNIVSLVLRQAILGDEIRLRDLSPRRDYLHIDDLVSAILAIVNKRTFVGLDIYNLGFGRSVSIADIISETGIIMGKQFHVIESAEKRTNEIADCYADISKFSNEFGWTPRLGLREGLRHTLLDFM